MVKLRNSDPSARSNVVDTDRLKQTIRMIVKSGGKIPPLLIWGAPGIGKTAIWEQVIEEFPSDEYNLITISSSTMRREDLFLHQLIVKEDREVFDSIPVSWLPVYKPTRKKEIDAEADKALGKGVLFFDDLSRAMQPALNLISHLVHFRSIMDYTLGSGWAIIAASNRMDDEESGQSRLGNALLNCFMQIYYEPTVNSWAKWAREQNYISPVLVDWLELGEDSMGGGKFFYYDPNEDFENGDVSMLMCTPRSWTNAMRKLALYSETASLEGMSIFDIPENILKQVLNTYVDRAGADSFVAFMKLIKEVGDLNKSIESVWKKNGSQIPLKDKGRLKKIAIPLAQVIVSAHRDELPTEKEFTSLCTWLTNEGSAQIASYVFDMFKKMYLDMIDDKAANMIYMVSGAFRAGAKAENDAKRKKAAENMYAKFLDKWGLTIDTMPDWSVGYKMLADTFSKEFSATIDGKDALG